MFRIRDIFVRIRILILGIRTLNYKCISGSGSCAFLSAQLVRSALAWLYGTAGPISNLGSAPQGGLSPLSTEEMPRRMEMGDCIVLYHCSNVIRNACIEKDIINKSVATATEPLDFQDAKKI